MVSVGTNKFRAWWHTLPCPLCWVWRHRLAGPAIAAAIAALAGVLVALAMPRGPATAEQALVAMAGGLAVGLACGVVVKSRWAMLLAPAAHIAALELARLDVVGPTVDAIRFDGTFAILALVLGRGFHGVVGILPMVLGAGVGAALGKRRAGARPSCIGRVRNVLRWVPVALVAVGLAALALLIRQPASTPAILGADGRPLPGSIAEVTKIRLGGH